MIKNEAVEESEGFAQAETLRGDIRDMLLAEIERMGAAWEDLEQIDRNIIRDRINRKAHDIVYSVIEIVHADEAPSLMMTVHGVNFKKGFTATLAGAISEPNRHLLADAVECDVMVIVPGATNYFGEKQPIEEVTEKKPSEYAGNTEEKTGDSQ